ncbi:MAG: 6-phosphofructokinase [Ruminococcaceae bacterium]|nr:6-phosphofructokinase [Oscillospiraceae bacterium]
MEILHGNAIVGQSGGPTTAINATLAGVISGAMNADCIDKVYGMRNGIDGLLADRLVLLNELFTERADFERLKRTPAAALGSCRKKLPKEEDKDYKAIFERIIEIFKKYDIRYFFYIGGNDSMDTVAKLSKYTTECGYEVRVIGVPKTIDNDLLGTDHTPGFGSAAKYISVTMQEILRDTAVYTVKAVTVVEIMGRDAGWLTASSELGRVLGLPSPDLVYLPERDFNMDEFFEDLSAALEKKPNIVVAVSEGLRMADGTFVGESTQSGAVDAFGHKYLSGTGKALELAIKENLGCKVRSIELNLPQRCAAHIASKCDIEESFGVGSAAVSAAVQGVSREMMVILRDNDPGEPYSSVYGHMDIDLIANKTKFVPKHFINERGNHVTDECLNYILPLVKGECYPEYKDGLPVFATI